MKHLFLSVYLIETRHEKTCLRGFRSCPTQIGLCNHRSWLEAGNFVLRKQSDCTIYAAKTKSLISCAVFAQLICAFVFAYAKSRFCHDAAHHVLLIFHCDNESKIYTQKIIEPCYEKTGFLHIRKQRRRSALR